MTFKINQICIQTSSMCGHTSLS